MLGATPWLPPLEMLPHLVLAFPISFRISDSGAFGVLFSQKLFPLSLYFSTLYIHYMCVCVCVKYTRRMMACGSDHGSDLTPVKGNGVRNKTEKGESLRSWWA